MKKSCLSFLFVLQVPLCATTLQEKYAWPAVKPNCRPDFENLFINEKQLGPLLKKNMKLIVELGSWLGSSTRFILDKAPNAVVIAIDHWKGSIEHHENNYWSAKLPTLYETFLVNCWRYKDRLIPMKTTTLEGLQEIYDARLVPNLIYVDAGHDYASVTADLEKIYSLFPTSQITGDDWSWSTVRAAVTDFARRHSFIVQAKDNFWALYKNKWAISRKFWKKMQNKLITQTDVQVQGNL